MLFLTTKVARVINSSYQSLYYLHNVVSHNKGGQGHQFIILEPILPPQCCFSQQRWPGSSIHHIRAYITSTMLFLTRKVARFINSSYQSLYYLHNVVSHNKGGQVHQFIISEPILPPQCCFTQQRWPGSSIHHIRAYITSTMLFLTTKVARVINSSYQSLYYLHNVVSHNKGGQGHQFIISEPILPPQCCFSQQRWPGSSIHHIRAYIASTMLFLTTNVARVINSSYQSLYYLHNVVSHNKVGQVNQFIISEPILPPQYCFSQQS